MESKKVLNLIKRNEIEKKVHQVREWSPMHLPTPAGDSPLTRVRDSGIESAIL
eukprot:gene9778-6856_t